MNIDSKVLVYLKGRGPATLAQVEQAVPETDRLVYASLRRLSLLGMVTKTYKRDAKSLRKTTRWEINREWTPPPVAPQSWLSALEWKPSK